MTSQLQHVTTSVITGQHSMARLTAYERLRFQYRARSLERLQPGPRCGVGYRIYADPACILINEQERAIAHHYTPKARTHRVPTTPAEPST